jgi:hypothetical protein
MKHEHSARWLSLLALPLAACIIVVDDDGWGRTVRGSGVRAEEDRPVAAFHAIELGTCAAVLVKVGEAPSLHLSGDDNLLPLVKTRVDDGVLSVDTSGSISFGCRLQLVIGTPSLDGFTIEGSGDVEIQGLTTDRLELAIEGSGTIRAQGKARDLIGSIEGSGSLELDELDAASADLSIEGSGAMEVHVAEVLRYSIEGSGEIRYGGEPDIGGRIEGSGKVQKNH